VPHSDRCPADLESIAKSYCMGSLDYATSVAFEDHFLTCARCAKWELGSDAEHGQSSIGIAPPPRLGELDHE